jgi:hypothetical protein
MIIYKCRFSNDEMLSDAFKPQPVVDDAGAEVEGLFQIQSQKVNKVGVRSQCYATLRSLSTVAIHSNETAI